MQKNNTIKWVIITVLLGLFIVFLFFYDRSGITSKSEIEQFKLEFDANNVHDLEINSEQESKNNSEDFTRIDIKDSSDLSSDFIEIFDDKVVYEDRVIDKSNINKNL